MDEWQPARMIPRDRWQWNSHSIGATDYECAEKLLPKVFRVRPLGRDCSCGAPRLAIHPEDLPGSSPSVCSTAVVTD